MGPTGVESVFSKGGFRGIYQVWVGQESSLTPLIDRQDACPTKSCPKYVTELRKPST